MYVKKMIGGGGVENFTGRYNYFVFKDLSFNAIYIFNCTYAVLWHNTITIDAFLHKTTDKVVYLTNRDWWLLRPRIA